MIISAKEGKESYVFNLRVTARHTDREDVEYVLIRINPKEYKDVYDKNRRGIVGTPVVYVLYDTHIILYPIPHKDIEIKVELHDR